MKYKIIKCPYCGLVQLSTVTKVFRCQRCSCSRKLSLNLEIIRSFDDFRTAHAFISEYKRINGF